MTNRNQALRIHLTYEDYLDMPDDGRRYEIIEGEVAVTPSPILWHQELIGRLYLLFVRWIDTGAGGKVYMAPATVILANDTIVEPDLFWISRERLESLAKDVVHGAPDLVVEVLSPSTARRDRGVKSQAYARHGVREYWLVDPDAQTVTILAYKGRRLRPHAAGGGDAPVTSSIDDRLAVIPRDLFRR